MEERMEMDGQNEGMFFPVIDGEVEFIVGNKINE